MNSCAGAYARTARSWNMIPLNERFPLAGFHHSACMLALWLLLLPLAASAQDSRADRLPPLPQLRVELFEPAIRDTVSAAYEEARRKPADGEVNGRLGMVLQAHQQLESAAQSYQRASLLQPGAFRWRYLLGTVQAELGETEQAAESLQSALDRQPDYFPARLKLAEALFALGNARASLNLYEQLATEHADSSVLHYGLGRVHFAAGNLRLAERSYRRACEISRDFRAAHYALARIYTKLGDTAKAERHLALYRSSRGAAPAPEDPLMRDVVSLRSGARSHLERGLAHQDKGEIERAIAAYHEALRIQPDYVQAHVNLLAAYVSLSDWGKARQYYEKTVALHRDSAEAHYNYGIVLSRQGNRLKARRAFRKALQINPFYAEAHSNIGYIEAQDGDLELAAKHFRLALQHRPGYREAQYNLARVLMERNEFHDVIALLEPSVDVVDDYSPRLLHTLADACTRAGLFESGISYARKAAELAASLDQHALASQIREELNAAEKELSKHP
ncbi:MAG: tetratricopeptide repeat protein [Luteitalea sp.]|nr:tetratricopeptide repeat protein [Luteitalea sp.]